MSSLEGCPPSLGGRDLPKYAHTTRMRAGTLPTPRSSVEMVRRFESLPSSWSLACHLAPAPTVTSTTSGTVPTPCCLSSQSRAWRPVGALSRHLCEKGREASSRTPAPRDWERPGPAVGQQAASPCSSVRRGVPGAPSPVPSPLSCEAARTEGHSGRGGDCKVRGAVRGQLKCLLWRGGDFRCGGGGLKAAMGRISF